MNPPIKTSVRKNTYGAIPVHRQSHGTTRGVTHTKPLQSLITSVLLNVWKGQINPQPQSSSLSLICLCPLSFLSPWRSLSSLSPVNLWIVSCQCRSSDVQSKKHVHLFSSIITIRITGTFYVYIIDVNIWSSKSLWLMVNQASGKVKCNRVKQNSSCAYQFNQIIFNNLIGALQLWICLEPFPVWHSSFWRPQR